MPMSTEEQANLEVIRRYFETMSKSPAGSELGAFYTADAVQEEFPNRFLPNGAKRDLKGLLEAAERGRGGMSAQSFAIVNAIASGTAVAVEGTWWGTLSKDIGPIPAGTTMRARISMFMEMRDGRIAAQRNYDCFEPW